MTDNNTKQDKVQVARDDAITRVTIWRPKRLNALDVDVLEGLTEAVNEAGHNGTRVMVISGSGEKAFVAGADIGMMEHFSPREALEFSRKGHELMLALDRVPFISVARVQGYALGGGCELAMACDMIVASEKAVFGQPEVGLGLIPGFGGTQMLVARIGLSVATDLVATGRRISGRDAAALGMVSRVSDHDRLDEEVEDVIKGVLEGDAHAIRESKRLLRQSLYMPFEIGLSSEAASFGNCFDRQPAGEARKTTLRRHVGKKR